VILTAEEGMGREVNNKRKPIWRGTNER